VADPPITAAGTSITGTQGQPFTGTVATFSQPIPGAAADDYSATIDWGDGNTSDGTIAANATGGFTVTGSNTFEATGSLGVKVTIDDNAGMSATATASATVAAPAPTFASTNADSVGEGQTYTLSLAFLASTNTGVSTWSVNWGDGTAVDSLPGTAATDPHTFPADCSLATIVVDALDASSHILGTGSLTVNVAPAAPQNVLAQSNANGTATVTWTDASTITGSFTILESIDGGQTYTAIGTAATGQENFTTAALDPTQSYNFEVIDSSGTNGSGTSGAASNNAFIASTSSSGGGGSSGGGSSGSGGSAGTTGTTRSLSVAPGSDPTSSAILTLTYSGNDDFGFEVEREDETTGENFHLFAQPGPIDPDTGSETLTVGGLTSGDQYLFRARTDYADGTVSDYSSMELYTAQTPQPPDGNDNTNPDLPVPYDVKVTPDSDGIWSDMDTSLQYANEALPPGAYFNAYNTDAERLQLLEPSDPFHVLPQSNVSGWYDNSWTNPSDNHDEYDGFAQFYPGYTYRISFAGDVATNSANYSTQYSSWTQFTVPGVPMPAPTNVQASQPVDGNITISWGPSKTQVYSTESYTIFGVSANNEIVSAYSADGNATSRTISATPGVVKYFMVAYGANARWDGDGTMQACSGYSNYATPNGGQAKTPPEGPAFAHAVYNASVPGGQVDISWANSSDDETSFVIYRNGSGEAQHVIGTTQTDQTTFVDHVKAGEGAWHYTIYAKDDSLVSQLGATAAVDPKKYVILLLRGDNEESSSSPSLLSVNQLHESVGAGYYIDGKLVVTEAFSFGTSEDGVGWKYYNEDSWLGWTEDVGPDFFWTGSIYPTDNYYKSVVNTKTVMSGQWQGWLNYMVFTRIRTPPDAYNPVYLNCRTYSQKEFAQAPGVQQ
jgi:hypothetical protein